MVRSTTQEHSSMNVIAGRRQDLSLLIELGDLLCQESNIRPSRPVAIRDPSRPQIPVAVKDKFHVLRACPFTEQVRNGEGSTEEGIAAGDLSCALRDDRKGH